MNTPIWVYFLGLGGTLVGVIVGGVMHAIKVSYRFGQHDKEQEQLKERMDKVESRANTLDAQLSEIQVMKAAFEALKEQVVEMRRDIKNLLTSRPTRRREAE